MVSSASPVSESNPTPPRTANPSYEHEPVTTVAPHGGIALIAGGLLSGLFYGVVYLAAWAPLERYFLGHPVAIAATVLFFVGAAILFVKHLHIRSQWKTLRRVSDATLALAPLHESPSDQFREKHDAGFVAKSWLSQLDHLSTGTRRSRLVARLSEVLLRQTQRGTTKHLADDLRELSARDADEAHDSFALVRIIVWAIPMLGFLGTVIGITQTLGGLDFSDGNAAVDNLKSGLYVAFDTTALGLVLSVIAIFLQFPVEKSEQRLLATVDDRIGRLTSLHLPGDEPVDNQYALLAQLCEGVRAAVAESLDNQARLWRSTIDEAQGYWQQAHSEQSQSVVSAIQETLVPALRDHSAELAGTAERNQIQMDDVFHRWQNHLDTWQETIIAGAESMVEQQSLMMQHVDHAAQVREQATNVLDLQKTLAANLDILDETNRRLDENLGAAAGQGMADAMLTLARAVDILALEMAGRRFDSQDDPGDSERRAA